MSIASELLGMTLAGKKTGKQWEVVKKMDTPKDASRPNFSVGYEVTADDGVSAFLKATDLSLLTENGGSLLERAMAAMVSHQFEREVLEHCHGSNMDRIVVAIDWGDGMVVHNGVQNALFYLIFELADADLRVQTNTETRYTLAWSLSTMHELCTAVQQLHAGNVSHNDIKPANVLLFGDQIQKLSDLGCVTSPIFNSAYNDTTCAGDPKYASPEIMYFSGDTKDKSLCNFENRRAADLYNLGSLIYFLVNGCMLTPQIIMRLAKEHRPVSSGGGWNGNYLDVLPYWREAFGRCMEEFRAQLNAIGPQNSENLVNEITTIVYQLCDPDPSLRGHPLNRQQVEDQYGVNRYISAFDRLRRQVQVRG